MTFKVTREGELPGLATRQSNEIDSVDVSVLKLGPRR